MYDVLRLLGLLINDVTIRILLKRLLKRLLKHRKSDVNGSSIMTLPASLLFKESLNTSRLRIFPTIYVKYLIFLTLAIVKNTRLLS